MNPLVSVIVPVYNTAAYIEDCVESLHNQIYKNIEIVIINDGSTDKSDSIIKSLCKKYKNINYVISEENHGLCYTRNLGLKVCSGEWIVFLDSDDKLFPNSIQLMVNSITPNVDLVMTSFCRVDNGIVQYIDFNAEPGIYSLKELLSNLYFKIPLNWFSCIGTKLYKAKIIKEKELVFSDLYKYNEDIAFVVDYITNTKGISVLSDATYLYTKREGSIQHSKRKDPVPTILSARKKVRLLLQSENVFVSDCVKKMYIESIFDVIFGVLYSDWSTYDEFKFQYFSIIENDEFRYISELKIKQTKIRNIVLCLLLKNGGTFLLFLIMCTLRFTKRVL